MPAAEDQYSGDQFSGDQFSGDQFSGKQFSGDEFSAGEPPDSELHDSEQLEEIQLMSDLMIAASRRRRPGRLPQREIDAILGLRGAGSDADDEPVDWLPAPRAPGEEI